MADKLTKKTQITSNGSPVDAWIDVHITRNASIGSGPKMNCSDLHGNISLVAVNCCAILFKDCTFQRQGTDANFGDGGSNAVTGTPHCVVDMRSVFRSVYTNTKEGILAGLSGTYLIPLCLPSEYPSMKTLVNECCASFIAQQNGGNKHDDSHMANAMCCALASVCFHLSSEITLNGETPDGEKMLFLVEAFCSLSRTVKSIANCSVPAGKVLREMPYIANTADTFQSTIMSYIFGECPHVSIRVKHIGLAIQRFFNHNSWDSSFMTVNPTGLIGLLLIVPMISSLLETTDVAISDPEIEIAQVATINNIVRAINTAITDIVAEVTKRKMAESVRNTPLNAPLNTSSKKPTFAEIVGRKTNIPKCDTVSINKLILRNFASASAIPIVSVDLIDAIYDAVVARTRDRDIASLIGVTETLPFERLTSLTLFGRRISNYPVLLKSGNASGNSEQYDTGTWTPADPREWTGISLHTSKKSDFEITCVPIGLAEFDSGNTNGQEFIANCRITAGSDVMMGEVSGIAVTGMIYDPRTKRFVSCKPSEKINPAKTFVLSPDTRSIKIIQDGVVKYVINTPRIAESARAPLVCFKYCSVTIKEIPKMDILVHANTAVTSHGNIEMCQNLTGALAKLIM